MPVQLRLHARPLQLQRLLPLLQLAAHEETLPPRALLRPPDLRLQLAPQRRLLRGLPHQEPLQLQRDEENVQRQGQPPSDLPAQENDEEVMEVVSEEDDDNHHYHRPDDDENEKDEVALHHSRVLTLSAAVQKQDQLQVLGRSY